jgi:hypothetical protein
MSLDFGLELFWVFSPADFTSHTLQNAVCKIVGICLSYTEAEGVGFSS